MVLRQHLPRIIHSWGSCCIRRGIKIYNNFLIIKFLTFTSIKHKKKKIRNLGVGGRTCLDSPARKKDLKKAVGLYPCHNQGGNQVEF